MDVIQHYALGTFAWLGVQTLPLLFSPGLIVAMVSPQPKAPTPLETYLSRTLAFALLTIAFFNLLLSGAVPLTNRYSQLQSSSSVESRTPYALPTLTISTFFQTVSAVYCYVWWQRHGGLALVVGVTINTVFASVGLWCLLFANSAGKIGRRSGTDKRTSAYPFKNSSASSEKKKKSSRKDA